MLRWARKQDAALRHDAHQHQLEWFIIDLLRLIQWRTIHEGHRQGWAERNPGMWFCFECGSPAPTDFDPNRSDHSNGEGTTS